MDDNTELICENCGSKEFYPLVEYGSYVLMCRRCRQDVVATSWGAVKNLIQGKFDIIELDDQMNEMSIIATGEIGKNLELITTEASKGKKLMLRNSQSGKI